MAFYLEIGHCHGCPESFLTAASLTEQILGCCFSLQAREKKKKKESIVV